MGWGMYHAIEKLRYVYTVLVRRPVRERPLTRRRPRCRLEDDITIDFK